MIFNVIIKILLWIGALLKHSLDYINKMISYFNYEDIKFDIIYKNYDKKGRFLVYILHNKNRVPIKRSVRAIYNTLLSDDKFITFGKKKVIITSVILEGLEKNFHHNVLLTNDSTFESYYNSVKDIIQTNYEYGYSIDMCDTFKIRVWNVDRFDNKDIKITSSTLNKPDSKFDSITTSTLNYDKISLNLNRYHRISCFGFPIKGFPSLITGFSRFHLCNKFYHKQSSNKKSNNENFITPIENKLDDAIENLSAMDIETILINDVHHPISISISWNCKVDGYKTKLFIVDNELFLIDKDKAIQELFKNFFNFIVDNYGKFKYIFVHNLGSYDGYFIYKQLSNFYESDKVDCIIDDKNKFIRIELKIKLDKWTNFTITWKDSYRIFPVKLDDLCKSLGIEGKISNYNMKFNNIKLFENPSLLEKFKSYALQDTICLLKALEILQDKYHINHKIEISSILSTSTLSLKIFRKNFLNDDIEIPVLKGEIDKFIRKSYLGGATDYYIAEGEDLYYYDVNSLYPHVMRKDMPYKLIKEHKHLSNYNLNDFLRVLFSWDWMS